MFGWIIGTVCLVALFATVKRRRFYERHGLGYGQFAGFYGPPRRLRRRGMLRGLFMQLETTPGQENAIVAALDETFERLRGLKTDVHGARRELGALLGSEVLDQNALEDLLGKQRAQLETASHEVVRMVARVHEVLDDHQRRELGALVADGSFGPSVVRGYRHSCSPAYGY